MGRSVYEMATSCYLPRTTVSLGPNTIRPQKICRLIEISLRHLHIFVYGHIVMQFGQIHLQLLQYGVGLLLLCMIKYGLPLRIFFLQRFCRHYDKVVILSENCFCKCLLRRNNYRLSHSCGVIAYYDGKPKGGTYYSVRKTERMEMDIVNIYDQRG